MGLQLNPHAIWDGSLVQSLTHVTNNQIHNLEAKFEDGLQAMVASAVLAAFNDKNMAWRIACMQHNTWE